MIPSMVMKRWYIKGETLPEKCVCGGEWKKVYVIQAYKLLECTICSRWVAEVRENGQAT